MSKPTTPSQLEVQSFLMNFPFKLSAEYANNPLMQLLENREIDHTLANQQFLKLYHFIADDSLVYLLPSEGNFQDQVYVANLGIYFPHITDRNVVIISKYTSPPRIGEDQVGIKFFTSMEYEVHHSPHCWEGEADLKHVRDNIYIGGYGIRSDIKAFEWMDEEFGTNIIPVRMTDEKLYHFDCLCLPLGPEKVLIAKGAVSRSDIKKIEQVAEVINVPKKLQYEGITNSVIKGNALMYASKNQTEIEKESVKFLDKLCEKHGLMLYTFDLGEFEKSGADLSCMIFHLNYAGVKR